MSVEIELSGHTVILTGAGRGIGRRIATRFAEAGANVVAAARTESEIRDTVEHIESMGAEGLAVPTDLRSVSDIDNLVDRATERFGPADILINNAGANLTNPPFEQTIEEIETMLDVNLKGLFLLSQRYGQTIREHAPSDGGRVINISSISASVGVPQMTLYGGTNAGINGITRGLASELARDGVTVNSISPGLVRVDRTENLIEEKGEDIYDFDRIPLGRVGDPDDIANACLFLASDLASYITGQELLVDGGVSFTAGLYK